MTHRLILDISRTLSRATNAVPTGIDRLELVYAEGLLARCPGRLEFAVLHPLGRFGRLPTAAARRFLELAAQRWRTGDVTGDAVRRAARSLLGTGLLGTGLLRGGLTPRRRPGPTTYLNVSHHHLDRRAVIAETMDRYRAGFVCLMNDLIPMQYPEYARPAEPARHERRIRTIAELATGIMVPSTATAAALQPWLDRAGRAAPMLMAPLGVTPPAPAGQNGAGLSGAEPPFFVLVSTIEPRKNHLLLLHVWSRLVERLGPAAPRLVLVGRRGWENEQVVDMIERCAALHGVVEERADLSDTQAAALLRGARALLMPSFAEGYGLPVAEALAAGTPVLCTDMPVFREVGGGVPDYLDPLDGLAWMRAVEDYAAPGSPRRAAQLARLAAWTVPTWDAHLDQALTFVDGLVRGVPLHAPPDRARAAPRRGLHPA